MSTNKQTRDMKTTTIAELKASIEELTADASKTAKEIADLGDQIAAVDAAVAKATEERNEEKAKNTKTVEDAGNAKAAVESALSVLKQFYDKAANPQPVPVKGDGPIKYDDRAIAILSKASGGASFIQESSFSQQSPMEDAPDMPDKPFTGTGDGGGG